MNNNNNIVSTLAYYLLNKKYNKSSINNPSPPNIWTTHFTANNNDGTIINKLWEYLYYVTDSDSFSHSKSESIDPIDNLNTYFDYKAIDSDKNIENNLHINQDFWIDDILDQYDII